MQKLLEAVKADDLGKFDLLTPVRALGFTAGASEPILVDREHEKNFNMSEWAYGQVCFKLGMPAAYMRKLPVELQLPHFDHWLDKYQQETQEKREQNVLLRCRGAGEGVDQLRAVLGGKYGVLNNSDAIQMLWDATKGVDWAWQVKSHHLSDRSLVARMVFGDREMKVSKDKLYPGMVLSNSEIGALQVTIGLMVYRLVCTNGMIVGEEVWSVKRKHIGTINGGFRDRIQNMLTTLPSAVLQMEAMVGRSQTREVPESYMLGLEARLTKGFMEKVIDTVAVENQGKLTYWALANAISRRSQDSVDAEKRIDYDQIAGEALLKAAA